MRKQRIISILLTLCLVIGMLPTTALAASVEQFTDVAADSWYYQDVDFVADKGYFKGMSDTIFAPNETMTRAMFVTVLSRFAGAKVDDSQSTFTDVPTGQWYTGAVTWAAKNKIVEGRGNGIFDPSGNVTREEMCTIIARYLDKTGTTAKKVPASKVPDLTDMEQISAWALDAVEACLKYGVIYGYPDGTFGPKITASRAHVAAILHRLQIVVYGGGSRDDDDDDTVEYTVTLKAEPAEAGTVTGAGKYEDGTEITVAAAANANWKFVGWYEGDAVLANTASYTFKVTRDIELTAKFEKESTPPTPDEKVIITATANNDAWGTVTGSGEYEKGAAIELVAIANEGYHFVEWQENGAKVEGAEATYAFTATANRTLVAVFGEDILPPEPPVEEPVDLTYMAVEGVVDYANGLLKQEKINVALKGETGMVDTATQFTLTKELVQDVYAYAVAEAYFFYDVLKAEQAGATDTKEVVMAEIKAIVADVLDYTGLEFAEDELKALAEKVYEIVAELKAEGISKDTVVEAGKDAVSVGKDAAEALKPAVDKAKDAAAKIREDVAAIVKNYNGDYAFDRLHIIDPATGNELLIVDVTEGFKVLGGLDVVIPAELKTLEVVEAIKAKDVKAAIAALKAMDRADAKEIVELLEAVEVTNNTSFQLPDGKRAFVKNVALAMAKQLRASMIESGKDGWTSELAIDAALNVEVDVKAEVLADTAKYDCTEEFVFACTVILADETETVAYKYDGKDCIKLEIPKTAKKAYDKAMEEIWVRLFAYVQENYMGTEKSEPAVAAYALTRATPSFDFSSIDVNKYLTPEYMTPDVVAGLANGDYTGMHDILEEAITENVTPDMVDEILADTEGVEFDMEELVDTMTNDSVHDSVKNTFKNQMVQAATDAIKEAVVGTEYEDVVTDELATYVATTASHKVIVQKSEEVAEKKAEEKKAEVYEEMISSGATVEEAEKAAEEAAEETKAAVIEKSEAVFVKDVEDAKANAAEDMNTVVKDVVIEKNETVKDAVEKLEQFAPVINLYNEVNTFEELRVAKLHKVAEGLREIERFDEVGAETIGILADLMDQYLPLVPASVELKVGDYTVENEHIAALRTAESVGDLRVAVADILDDLGGLSIASFENGLDITAVGGNYEFTVNVTIC